MRNKNAFGKAVLAFVSLLLVLLSIPLSTYAAEPDRPSMEEARAVWFSHLESGKTVASKEADTIVGAGSAVKVMSGLLFCEVFAERLEESVELDGDVWSTAQKLFAGRQLPLREGDAAPLSELLYAAICGSYNDAFYLLAIYLDGSLDAFLMRMNQRARELGMKNTDFADVTGVRDGSRTTASDIAKLATFAYQNQLYMQLCNTKSHTFTSMLMDKRFLNNNYLICYDEVTQYYQSYCLGMSAGSSSSDGNCVITVAKHNNETYICVVLGGAEVGNELYGYRIVNRLVTWVYKTYSYIDVVSPKKEICRVPVTVSDNMTDVILYTDETLSAYLPKGAEKEIVYSIRLTNQAMEAPFEKHTFAGYLAVIYQGEVLGTVKLYTAAGAERSGFVGSLLELQSWTQNRAVIAGLIFFIVALTAWIVTETLLIRRRRHRWDKYFSNKMEMPEELLRQKRPDPNRLRRK